MKEKVNKLIEIMTKIKPRTYISLVMIIFLIINTICTYVSGEPIIKFSEEQITDAVNIILNVVIVFYTFWKNQSFTDAALAADSILEILRDGKITKEELEAFIEKYKTAESEATEEAKKEVTEETVETTEEVKPETVETIETTETTEETK